MKKIKWLFYLQPHFSFGSPQAEHISPFFVPISPCLPELDSWLMPDFSLFPLSIKITIFFVKPLTIKMIIHTMANQSATFKWSHIFAAHAPAKTRHSTVLRSIKSSDSDDYIPCRTHKNAIWLRLIFPRICIRASKKFTLEHDLMLKDAYALLVKYALDQRFDNYSLKKDAERKSRGRRYHRRLLNPRLSVTLLARRSTFLHFLQSSCIQCI